MTSAVTIQGLYQVGVTTADLDAAIAFYRDRLGLQLTARFDPPGLAFLALGNVRLSLQLARNPQQGDTALYFRVADVHEAAESLLAASVTLESEPQRVFRDDQGQFGAAGEEEWMVFFRDPDGHLLAYVSRK